jgi:hypothetical protein
MALSRQFNMQASLIARGEKFLENRVVIDISFPQGQMFVTANGHVVYMDIHDTISDIAHGIC